MHQQGLRRGSYLWIAIVFAWVLATPPAQAGWLEDCGLTLRAVYQTLHSRPPYSLETERTRLTAPSGLEIRDLRTFFSHRQVARWYPRPASRPFAYSVEVVERNRQRAVPVFFSIHDPQGKFMGIVELHSFDGTTAYLGYALHPDYHGRGLAREAVAAFLSQVPAAAGLTEVKARVRVENEASRRILERVGFEPDGEVREGYHYFRRPVSTEN